MKRARPRRSFISTVAGLCGLLLAAGAGALEQVSLDEGGYARIGTRPGLHASIRLRGATGVLRGLNPACPVGSWIGLRTRGGARWEHRLDCERWRVTRRGLLYTERAPGRVVVEVRTRPDTRRIALAGMPSSLPHADPVVEVVLQVHTTRYCARLADAPQRRFRPTWLRVSRDGCATPAPPNFVVVNLDDARFDGLDRMPVLADRLAAEGLRFENAFTPCPTCSPSRASLFTGRYALHHGTRSVGEAIGGADTFRESGSDRETVAVWLQRAGYRTGLFGKYLNAYSVESEGDKGAGGRFYVPPGWDRFWGLVSTEHYGGVLGQSYTVVDQDATLERFDRHDDDAQYSTDLSAHHLRDFIAESVAARRPFFAYWAPYAPHVETPGYLPMPAIRHRGALGDLGIWAPGNWNEADVGDKPRWVQLRGNHDGLIFANAIVRLLAYETLLAVDEQLAALLDQLVALGIDENTVVIVTSDHGAGWGEHRLFGQNKGCPYEVCQRVPLIVRWPGGLRTSAEQSFANLARAVSDRLPEAVVGHNRAAARIRVVDESGGSYGVNWWIERDASGRLRERGATPDYFGVRDAAAGYTWVEYANGERELYDLVEDPLELENRADDPAYAATRARLEERLGELLSP